MDDLNVRDLVASYLRPLASCLPCLARPASDEDEGNAQGSSSSARRGVGSAGRTPTHDEARVALLTDGDADVDNSDAFSLHSNVGRVARGGGRLRRTGQDDDDGVDSTTDGTRSEDGSASASSPRKARRKGPSSASSSTGSAGSGSGSGRKGSNSSGGGKKPKKKTKPSSSLAELEAEEAELAAEEEAAIRKARRKALAKARKQGLIPTHGPPHYADGMDVGGPGYEGEGTWYYDEYGRPIFVPSHGHGEEGLYDAAYQQGYHGEGAMYLEHGPYGYPHPPEGVDSPLVSEGQDPSSATGVPSDSPLDATAAVTSEANIKTEAVADAPISTAEGGPPPEPKPLSSLGLTSTTTSNASTTAAARKYTRSNGSGSGSGLSGAKRYDFGSARTAHATSRGAPTGTGGAASTVPPSPSSHLSGRSSTNKTSSPKKESTPVVAAVVEDDDEEIERLDEVDGLF